MSRSAAGPDAPSLADTDVRSRSFGLDGLRAIAVGLVLTAHAGSLVWPVFQPGREIILMAYWGVELFFALSGFLIGRIVIEGCRAGPAFVPEFWLRRWLRTLPNYYLFLLLNALFVRLVQGGDPPWPAYTVFVQNLLWPHPAFFGEAWSLALEEIFYVLAPLAAVVFAPLLRTRAAVLTALLLALAAMLLLRIGYVLRLQPDWDEGVRKVALIRLDAIGWGVLAAWLSLRFTLSARMRGVLAALGAGLVAATGVAFMACDPNQGWFLRSALFTLTSLGFAAWMPWAAHCRGRMLGERMRRAVTRVALWSYALYLTHMLVIRLIAQSPLPRTTPLEVGVAIALYAACSLAWAAAVYRWYERPILGSRDAVVSWLLRPRARASR